MNIRNESVTIVNICGKYAMPNQVVTVDDKVKDNPVIQKFVKAGKLSIVSDSAKTIDNADNTEEEFNELLENNPSVASLKRFAKKYGIGLSDAKTTDEIIAVIKASVVTAKMGE